MEDAYQELIALKQQVEHIEVRTRSLETEERRIATAGVKYGGWEYDNFFLTERDQEPAIIDTEAVTAEISECLATTESTLQKAKSKRADITQEIDSNQNDLNQEQAEEELKKKKKMSLYKRKLNVGYVIKRFYKKN